MFVSINYISLYYIFNITIAEVEKYDTFYLIILLP